MTVNYVKFISTNILETEINFEDFWKNVFTSKP